MEHECVLADRIGALLFNPDLSDITFIVEGEAIPAHRIVVAASCDYFRYSEFLLYPLVVHPYIRGLPRRTQESILFSCRLLIVGQMQESRQSEIVLQKIPARGFKQLMKYIYTGQLKLNELDEDTILEVLGVIQLYGFEKLERSLCEYLEGILSVVNVCKIFEKALHLQLECLTEACHHFMDQAPEAVLRSAAFQLLSPNTLRQVISRDTFSAAEIEIFEAVEAWSVENPNHESLPKILDAIRLPLISHADLLTTVRSSGLIAQDRLLDAMRIQECAAVDIALRGVLVNGENVATADRGALVLKSCSKGYLAPKNCPVYSTANMSDRRLFGDAETGVTIALGKSFLINNITFRFAERGPLCYSYYIQVSANLVDWVKIIDYSNYVCRSSQRLLFEPRVARYIRIKASDDSLKKDLCLSEFQARHIQTKIPLREIYEPEENVATVEAGASLIECHTGRDEVISSLQSTAFTDVQSNIRHQIGKGSITIQLSQPYSVNCMRLLLDPCWGEYSYYIEISLDKNDWTRVVDRTAGFHHGLQTIHFDTRPVIFIKIVGTKSSKDKVRDKYRFQDAVKILLFFVS